MGEKSQQTDLKASPSLKLRRASRPFAGLVKFFIAAGFCFALGFAPQVLMYLRMQQNPEINWGHAQGFSGFLYFVRRAEFGSIFLLSNAALTFNLLKLFRQFSAYFRTFAVDFGILFVISAPFIFVGRLYRERKILMLGHCFLILVVVQLTLLSTIDPTGNDNPFQLNKFYLTSFVIFVLILGASLEEFKKRFFEDSQYWLVSFLVVLILIYFAVSFRVNNLSSNYFSQNMVLDALEQVPDGSMVITVSHVFFFGGLYEQKVNGRFGGLTLIYFPNEFNRDGEYYRPEVFGGTENREFIEKVHKDKVLGHSEEYVLSTISKNLDRDIYILQGSFEEGFFRFLKPYIKPYGLFWKVDGDVAKVFDPDELVSIFGKMRNRDVKYTDFILRQQALDTLTYSIAYFSSGVYLGSLGKYDDAISLMQKSLAVRDKGDNVKNSIDLVVRTRDLGMKEQEMFAKGELDGLVAYGNNLYTLGNFDKCVEVFGKMVQLDGSSAQYLNNLASCYASLGRAQEARTYYEKALSIDPDLGVAKEGLEALNGK